MPNDQKPKLANTEGEWQEIWAAEESPFIRSLAEWDAFLKSDKLQQHALASLDKAAHDAFRSHLQFVELSVNTKPLKRCCISWYYGDLLNKHNFTSDQLLEVASLFGIGKDRFLARSDKFGDIKDDNVCCRPRLNFNCPDAPDCKD